MKKLAAKFEHKHEEHEAGEEPEEEKKPNRLSRAVQGIQAKVQAFDLDDAKKKVRHEYVLATPSVVCTKQKLLFVCSDHLSLPLSRSSPSSLSRLPTCGPRLTLNFRRRKRT